MSEDDDLLEDVLKAVVENNAYYEELEGESPRAAAILAVASLEDELGRLIRSKFPPALTDKAWKDIAGPGFTPLGSYKARNQVACAFGFYGSQTKATLETISSVRNKFAHRRDVRNFSHPIVLALCNKLSSNPISPFVCTENTHADEVRRGFISLVELLEGRLEKIRQHLPELDGPRSDPLP
jgi:hypothetical protein